MVRDILSSRNPVALSESIVYKISEYRNALLSACLNAKASFHSNMLLIMTPPWRCNAQPSRIHIPYHKYDELPRWLVWCVFVYCYYLKWIVYTVFNININNA